MYQKRISPYFIIPSTFSPQASSPLSHHGRMDGQRDRFLHPLLPKFFLFSTERAWPYPQAQLYWAGRTMGWMANWTRVGMSESVTRPRQNFKKVCLCILSSVLGGFGMILVGRHPLQSFIRNPCMDCVNLNCYYLHILGLLCSQIV